MNRKQCLCFLNNYGTINGYLMGSVLVCCVSFADTIQNVCNVLLYCIALHIIFIVTATHELFYYRSWYVTRLLEEFAIR